MLLSIGIAVALLSGIMTGTLVTPTTEARPDLICFTKNYNEAFRPGAITERRGVRVINPGMSTFNNTESCGRVSSIFLEHSNDDWVEFGWFEIPEPIEGCGNFVTTGKPRVFSYVLEFGGNEECTIGQELNGGDEWHYLIESLDADGIYTFKFSGDVFSVSSDLFFGIALPLDNGERHSTASTNHAQADFNGLQFRNANQWVDWSTQGNAFLEYTDDPGYKGCRYEDGDRTTVIPNANSC